MAFEIEKTTINGLLIIKPKIYSDDRGFFMESYKYSDFKKIGLDIKFVQDNHSRSIKNVIRGIHFQKPPKEQAKLVKCVRGEIFDVAVDLRKNSKTYLKWFGIKLSDKNGYMLYIPKGFGHGFSVLSDFADVVYKCDEEYSPEHDSGIRYDDPDIKIDWQIKNPILSNKDLNLNYLRSL